MKIRLMLAIFVLFCKNCISQHRHTCFSPIYCQGDLLDVVQSARLFNDSKTFVDMALVYPMNQTLENFNQLMAETNENPTKDQVREFVNQHFKTIGELEDYIPRDFNPEPKIVKELNDPVIRKYVKDIVAIWPSLTRKVSYHVFEHPERYSLIPVSEPFVVPGGRFKEYYYWDSYWILKGLLLSDMFETARGMVQNLLSIVERYGFIPNGGRIYYLTRSQPPMLSLIVSDYIKVTKDFEFIRNNIKTLERELKFWLEKRVVEIHKDGQILKLAHYDSESDTPRPESYVEDIQTCQKYQDAEMYDCFTSLKAGAESGLDFSSRWLFDKKGDPSSDLSTIQTRRVIPVDLNAILYKCFVAMYRFYSLMQEPANANAWLDLAEKWRNAIEVLFWNEEDGTWYDYDAKNEMPRKQFRVSNIVPLWAGAVPDGLRAERGKRTRDYLVKNAIHSYRGGIPVTLLNSGQQWDFPNVWTPYQNMIIIGLEKSKHPEATKLAEELAHQWVNSNIRAYYENKAMFEKYNAQNVGSFGGGGEYHIQVGFGWSNGGILELIHMYHRARTRKFMGAF